MEWVRRCNDLACCMGEQGAESIHRRFNELNTTYSSIRNKEKRLLCVVKGHLCSSPPPLQLLILYKLETVVPVKEHLISISPDSIQRSLLNQCSATTHKESKTRCCSIDIVDLYSPTLPSYIQPTKLSSTFPTPDRTHLTIFARYFLSTYIASQKKSNIKRKLDLRTIPL